MADATVSFRSPGYPDSRAWMAAALDELEAEMLPIMRLLLEILP